MSLLEQASLVITPNAVKESILYSVVPSDGSGDMDVVRATTATRVNSAGLIESVASNVPRLDYTNGSCPSILVEPQRTNLFLYSEQFDNINWTKSNMNVTANSSTSPDGTTTADTITVTSTSAELYAAGTSATTTTTLSVFVKKGNQKYFGLTINGVNNFDSRYQAVFDLDNGTIFQENNSSTPLTNRSAKIESYANGWYKVSVTATFAILAVGFVVFQHSNSVPTIPSNNLAWNNSTNGNTFIWGAQLEAGSYATSYVPTLASSVTRNADVISKTGISSLIGQTEGTVFANINFKNTNTAAKYISINNGTNNNRINFVLQGNGSALILEMSINGISLANVGLKNLSNLNLFLKIALKYKSGEIKCFVDGQLLFSNTLTYSNAVFDRLLLTNPAGGQPFDGDVNSIQLYKTALTDTECIALTTL